VGIPEHPGERRVGRYELTLGRRLVQAFYRVLENTAISPVRLAQCGFGFALPCRIMDLPYNGPGGAVGRSLPGDARFTHRTIGPVALTQPVFEAVLLASADRLCNLRVDGLSVVGVNESVE